MSPLSTENVVALGIFASYFSIITGLFSLIVSSIHKRVGASSDQQRIWLFGGLTMASFGHTWFWMIRYMFWSFSDYENKWATKVMGEDLLNRVASWLTNTELFEQSWLVVCRGPLNWWWSEQLCLFTAGAFTVHLFLHKERVPHTWAYMVLGQLVAISVAWSLFNLALVVTSRQKSNRQRPTKIPLTLSIPVILSLLTVSLSPYTNAQTFLPNLLAMHALLVLPLLPPLSLFNPTLLAPEGTSFYTLIAIISTILRLRTNWKALSVLGVTSSPFFSYKHPADLGTLMWNAPGVVFEAAIKALHSHPAQASIGWDVIWTSFIWLVWGLFGYRDIEETRWTAQRAASHVFPTVVASVGVTAPMEFGQVLRVDDKALALRAKKE